MANAVEHFTPGQHQRLGARFLYDNPRSMLVADPGLGKTTMAYMALDMLQLAGSSFFPALILAPKRVADVVWSGEANKWDFTQDVNVNKIMGTQKERLEALRRPKSDVYVTNYDNIPWLVDQFGGGAKWPFKIVIADESSRLKGHRLNKGGVRAEALGKIARFTGRWWNLTGTPCPNGLHDLWGQMWFIDFGERLKRSYSAYLSSFFLENPYSHKITTQHGATEAIHELVKDRMMVLRAEDWLDITTPQEIPVTVTLPEPAMVQYRAMEKDYFLQLPDVEIEAGTAAVKSQKLLQMAAGGIYDGDVNPHFVHEAKLDALEEILDQIAPAPLLVAYWWKFDADRILERLKKRGIKAAKYEGAKTEDAWNAGKLRVILLQEQSAFGVSLHKPCRDVCFYSYYWSQELWKQMIERVGPARQAQAGKKCVVRIWSIRAAGTIDADVISSNEGKMSIENALKRARARVREAK